MVSGAEAVRGGAEMGVYSRVLRNGLQVYNRENMPVYQNGRGRLLYQAMTSYMMPPAWVYNALPLGDSLLSASSASCTSIALAAPLGSVGCSQIPSCDHSPVPYHR